MLLKRTLETLRAAQPDSKNNLGSWLRRGAAVAEFAVIAPVLVIFILGSFELTRGLWAKQTLSDAARRACRTGTQPNTNNATIIQDVNSILTANNINSATATITILVNA